MKIPRIPLIVMVSILAALLLSACSGALPYRSWPGVTASQGVAYLAYQNGVFALDLDSGELLWRYPAEPEGGKAFFAPPVRTDSQVVAGDYSNTLYGINSETGKQEWTFNQGTGNFVASPLVVNDTILAPSANHFLFALDLDGKLRWKFETKNVLWSQPVSDGETVYLSAMDHNMYALNLADGSLVWKTDLESALMSSPVLAEDGTLYVNTMGGTTFAVNSADGSVLWSVETGAHLWGSPVLHENVLYFGGAGGKIFAVSTEADAGSDRILWEFDAASPIIGTGALLPDGVVFPTEGGTVVAIGFDGKRLWYETLNGKLYTTPVVANDTILVAATEGEQVVTAFDLSGDEKWSFVPPQ